eukprot:373458-Alexandrium_andersonii.AAC.1
MLLEFLHSHDMKLSGSWFTRSPGKRPTYRSPGVDGLPGGGPQKGAYAELDHVLAPSRWASAVHKYRSHPEAGLMTDHFPVIFDLSMKFAAQKREAPSRSSLRGATQAQKD